ncbi:DUF3592 domain-containing protein [Variovorax paradoxus]|uniref:DUF3592 domain-containing protein n=1 Tax=Variovorax paradoxus TaxID=34073 RepID=UPI001933E955|nr:DUF3592 domain-containing protein [Variovorax paradoxus]
MGDEAVEHALSVFKYGLMAGLLVGAALVVWRRRLLLGIGLGALAIAAAGLYGAGSIAVQRVIAIADTVGTQGTLIEHIAERGTDSKGRTTVSRAPLVEYMAADGRKLRVKGLGGSASGKRPGDAVAVRYSPDDPARARVDDFQNMWGIVIAFCVFSLLPLLVGLFFTRMALRFRGLPGA